MIDGCWKFICNWLTDIIFSKYFILDPVLKSNAKLNVY